MHPIQSVAWSADGSGVTILDQRCLPSREVYRDLRTVADVCSAITTLSVRGAPAIGVTAAMGLSLALSSDDMQDLAKARQSVRTAADRLRATRPTAVNLAWALDRVVRHSDTATSVGALRRVLRDEASRILAEDQAMCRRIGEHGASLIEQGSRILTHCNTGALATAGTGTALAAVYAAKSQGKRLEVFADETRPLLQGSRLTAWELERAGIQVTVLVDGAAAALMRSGRVDLCIVGADRIAANGDVANKIGTYSLAVAAYYHGIPFYVAAPWSSFDPATPSGGKITIEERSPDEIRRGFGAQTAPDEARIFNPAFDVTPSELITAIISDRGIHRAPYDFRHLIP
ncbi:MAG TPA: S-methyl-5-thioribose-1-phosphate isomerase [Gemmatimonadaceae bacterium]